MTSDESSLPEDALKKLVLQGTLPKHIGVIPDGNRRYARKQGLSLLEAYERGVEKGEIFAEWCRNLGVKYLTFYTLSLENLERRSSDEKRLLFSLLKKHFKRLIEDARIHEDHVRVKVIGRISSLPRDLQEVIHHVEEVTASYNRYYLIFLIAYSGRAEIIDAINKLLVNGPKKIDENIFRNYLYMGNIPDPDLIIRTSGEMRISNFLLWYIAYSEFYFVKRYWPEITFKDLLLAIRNYQKRERRFGR